MAKPRIARAHKPSARFWSAFNPRHAAPEVRRLRDSSGIHNFEIESATMLPPYLLLRLGDHHVTVFSSVVTEAASFDLRTSLLDDVGASTFARYVERGIYRVTPTGESLVAHIAECLASGRTAFNDDFVNMRREAASQALAKLLT